MKKTKAKTKPMKRKTKRTKKAAAELVPTPTQPNTGINRCPHMEAAGWCPECVRNLAAWHTETEGLLLWRAKFNEDRLREAQRDVAVGRAEHQQLESDLGIRAPMMAVAVLCLSVDRTSFFLARRREDQLVLPGHFECVCGKLEASETPQQAAIRELKEESGLDIASHRLVPMGFMRCYGRDAMNVGVFLFVVQLVDGELPTNPEPTKREDWRAYSVSTVQVAFNVSTPVAPSAVALVAAVRGSDLLVTPIPEPTPVVVESVTEVDASATVVVVEAPPPV